MTSRAWLTLQLNSAGEHMVTVVIFRPMVRFGSVRGRLLENIWFGTNSVYFGFRLFRSSEVPTLLLICLRNYVSTIIQFLPWVFNRGISPLRRSRSPRKHPLSPPRARSRSKHGSIVYQVVNGSVSMSLKFLRFDFFEQDFPQSIKAQEQVHSEHSRANPKRTFYLPDCEFWDAVCQVRMFPGMWVWNPQCLRSMHCLLELLRLYLKFLVSDFFEHDNFRRLFGKVWFLKSIYSL